MSKRRRTTLVVVGFLLVSVVWPTLGAVLLLLGLLAWSVRLVYFLGYASGYEGGIRFGQELSDTSPEFAFWEPPKPAPSQTVAEQLAAREAARETVSRYAPSSEQ